MDALTEELEENTKEIAYDDYMFVTRQQLDELGLAHLIGNYKGLKCVVQVLEIIPIFFTFRYRFIKGIYARLLHRRKII